MRKFAILLLAALAACDGATEPDPSINGVWTISPNFQMTLSNDGDVVTGYGLRTVIRDFTTDLSIRGTLQGNQLDLVILDTRYSAAFLFDGELISPDSAFGKFYLVGRDDGGMSLMTRGTSTP